MSLVQWGSKYQKIWVADTSEYGTEGHDLKTDVVQHSRGSNSIVFGIQMVDGVYFQLVKISLDRLNYIFVILIIL